MKRITVLIPLLIIALLFVPHARALDVSLKLSGGRSFFNLQNIDRILDDWAVWKKKDTETHSDWTYIGGEVSKLHSSFDFAGEILVSLTPKITIGFGAGYIYSELVEDKTALTIERVVGTFLDVKPIKISALPLTISGYYFFPVSSKARLYVKGGAGPIWGKYIEREGRRLTTNENFTYQSFQRTSGRGSVVLAGCGFEYEFEPGMRVFFEALGRLCRISDFQGENNLEETGMLYSFEEYIPDFAIWQAKNQIMETQPSGENFRSVQKTTINISGIMIKIGLVFKF
ncbi:MAG: hypothetical protein MUP98_03750 [Candidatus Aminicenantes bacterium]|nr:hypothetical protein [Candidatus Aminicenantes bacterium]